MSLYSIAACGHSVEIGTKCPICAHKKHTDEIESLKQQLEWSLKNEEQYKKSTANALAENARLREALEQIKANQYGLQGLIEDGEPIERIAEYWAYESMRLQQIARVALSRQDTGKKS